ncbi:MAG TPA: glycosyltransferase family 1 protein [Candidatus Eremiobacteraceae bacterium]|nr:glycosyltransferase family 1 protein [Candidatus Eremiobacteraceae bacterium]
MSAPHIILDARVTKQMSVGMITYVRELAARLPDAAPDLSFTIVSNVKLDTGGDVGTIHIPERLAVNGSLGEQLGYAGLLRRLRRNASLTHLMSVYAPRWTPTPYVYTIHDLIHRRFPHYFKWKVRPYYEFVAGPVARGASAVITDAAATVPDLERFLGVDAAAVRIVPLGVSERFALDASEREQAAKRVRARLELRAPYIFYAGNHREHKNLETLAAAWQEVQGACDLVLTESMPFAFDLDRYTKRGGRIVRAGHVSEEELVELYAGCAATVQPSSYEGFGLSVLEGMAAGAPVIVAQTPALLEVAGDAALTFPVRDVTALTRAVELVLAGGADVEALRERGRRRASAYSWSQTARLTAGVYRECLAR